MNGLIVLLSFIWGINWVFMKLANGVFPPVLFAGIRFAVGSAVLLAVCLYRKEPLPKWKDFKWFVVCGVLQTAWFNLAIQLSLNALSAGLTSVLTYSMPLWMAVLAHFWIPGERLTVRKSAGVAVGIAGLFLAMDARLGGSAGWVLMALSSGVTWAVSNLIIKRKLAHCRQLPFTAWQMAAGAALLLLYSLMFEHGTSRWSVSSVFYIAFSGCVGSAFAFLLWSRILAKAEASRASVSLMLVPVIGVWSGVLMLHERLHWTMVLGLACVLAGIGLVNWKKPEAATSAA